MNDADQHDVAVRWDAAMRRGDFEAAWQQTDRIERARRREQALGSLVHAPCHLLWNGTPLAGRSVLVRCNHGLGDTLQFIRYVPLVHRVARHTTVLVQPMLLPLLESDMFGNVQNGWTDTPPPGHDVEIEVMELPYAFRSTATTLPARVPYLPMDNVHAFASMLPPWPEDTNALRVGLVWGSSEWDTSRSVPLSALAPLARVPQARFFGLQQGPLASAAQHAPFAIHALSPHTANIAVAAAAMLALDLIITVDCMVAHLAGALARPVWVLLKHDADWRWMDARQDSPWYPTMRLFRQPRRGDWATVGQALAAALAGAAVARAGYSSPARAGQ